MDNNPESWETVGLAGALVQSYALDQKGFVSSLAVLLEQAMPDSTTIVRKPIRLFSSDKRITSISVAVGDNLYTLADPSASAPLEAKRVKIVRGIALKTDALAVKEWLQEVGEEITNRAAQSKETLSALQNFLEIKSI